MILVDVNMWIIDDVNFVVLFEIVVIFLCLSFLKFLVLVGVVIMGWL